MSRKTFGRVKKNGKIGPSSSNLPPANEDVFVQIVGRTKRGNLETPRYATEILKPDGSTAMRLVELKQFRPVTGMPMPLSFDNGLRCGMAYARRKKLLFHNSDNRYYNEKGSRPIVAILSAKTKLNKEGGVDMPKYLVQFEGYPNPVWVEARALGDVSKQMKDGCTATVLSFRNGFIAGGFFVTRSREETRNGAD